MLQYILTGLAGIALGIVGMRIWQLRGATPATAGEAPAAAAGEPAQAATGTSPRTILIGAAVLAFLAGAVFVFRGPGSSDAGSESVAGAPSGAPSQALSDVDTMIAQLESRLKANPNDGEGFRMLGWSYMMTGKPDKALAPYEKAMSLTPNDATCLLYTSPSPRD